jgi:hypothetical protein
VVKSRFPSCRVDNIEKLYNSSDFDADAFGLTQTNVLWRLKPASPRMRALSELWLSTLKLGPCWRDQTGFDYAAWKVGMRVKRFLQKKRESLPERLRIRVDPDQTPLGFKYHGHSGKN